MSSYLYAAYGSNLHPLRLQQRIAAARLVGTAQLADHTLHFGKRSFHDGSGKCSILPGGPGVSVAVFELPVSGRETLDRIEGLEHGYERQMIELEEFGACETYVASAAAVDEVLRPLDWYKQLVVLGARFHRFADDYIAALEAVQADTDTDAARAATAQQLIRQMLQTGAGLQQHQR